MKPTPAKNNTNILLLSEYLLRIYCKNKIKDPSNGLSNFIYI